MQHNYTEEASQRDHQGAADKENRIANLSMVMPSKDEDRGAIQPNTTRERTHNPRPPMKGTEGMLSSRFRPNSDLIETKRNFKQTKEDLMLKMKGLNAFDDNGMRIVVGKYEAMGEDEANQPDLENLPTVTIGADFENLAGPQEGGKQGPTVIDGPLEANDLNEIKSFGEGGICSICFTNEPDAVYMLCGHGGTC